MIMPNPNEMWVDTQDLDQRFEARMVNDNNNTLDDAELRRDILNAVKLSDYPISVMDDTARSSLKGPMAVTLIRDKLTGNEVAAVAYDTLKNDWRETEEAVTKYQLLDMKNGKLLTESFDDAEAPNAKRKLGIDQDVELLPESMTVRLGDMAGKNIINTNNIGEFVFEAQEQSRLDIQDEPAVDSRIPLIKHVVFDKMANDFMEQRIEAVEKNESALSQSKEVIADDKNYSPKQRQAAYEDKEYLNNTLAAQRAESLDVLHNPQKLIINREGKMEISDGAELSNRFAQLRGSDTTQLGDVHKKFKIGKLAAEDIEKSYQIMAGDRVLAAARIVDTDGYTDTEYNIYAIEKDGSNDNNDMYNATRDRANKEGWIRAEKFEGGVLVAVNSHALKGLGIEDNQLNVGLNKSDAVRQAVSPEGLRQKISESQHIEYQAQLMSSLAAAEGNPNADTYREYKAADYTDSKRYDLSMDEDQAMHNIDSAYVDSRYKVLPVPPKQIEQMERLGVIPHANDPKSEHYEYIGTPNVFVIKDSQLGETRTFGQTLAHASAGYPGATKSYDTSDFELVTNGVDERIKVEFETTIEPGKVVWDHERIEGDDSINEVLGEQLSVVRDGTKYYAANSHGLHSSAYTPRDIMESLVDANSDRTNRDMSKLENNYGLGEQHETVEAYEALQEPAAYEAVTEIETAPEPVQHAASRRRPG